MIVSYGLQVHGELNDYGEVRPWRSGIGEDNWDGGKA